MVKNFEKCRELIKAYNLRSAWITDKNGYSVIFVPNRLFEKTYKQIKRKDYVRKIEETYSFGAWETTIIVSTKGVYGT